ncbi:hypothetical protein KEJ21_04665 [Candidatus Bathyarchaeota archaeon]|nr:hypothetical protein [Candidatus Bathyarchaeota archaeon]MBS7630244.1 hypothetical protein [Candidatus Bathyarchaeota archaeon]
MSYSFKYDKAITVPVTLVLVLLVSIIGAIGIIYIWSSTAQRTGHTILIQNVVFQQNQTRVYVQNVGKGTIILDTMYLGDDRFILQATNCTINGKGTNILEEGQTAEIIVIQSYRSKVCVKIICTDGTFHEGYWEP